MKIPSPYQKVHTTAMVLLPAPAAIARSRDVLLGKERSVDRRVSAVPKKDNNNVVVEDSLKRSSHVSVVLPHVDRDNSAAEELVVSPLPMQMMK